MRCVIYDFIAEYCKLFLPRYHKISPQIERKESFLDIFWAEMPKISSKTPNLGQK